MVLASKNILVPLGLLCLSLPALSRDRFIHGRVTDNNQHALATAVIRAEDRKEIFFCDAQGYFRFRANTDSIDAFLISSPGYDTKELIVDDLPEDSVFVTLQKTITVLKSTTIAAKGGELKEVTSGIAHGGHNASCYMEFKDEIAIYLPADESRNGIIKEIGAYITKEGAKDTKFLMHVYRRDTATGAPGEEITDSMLVLNARHGNEWVTADLSDKFIQVKGGVFVSVEWSLNYSSNYFTWDIKGASNYYSGDDSLRTVYNGQVLGLAWGSSRRPIVYRRYAHNIYEHKNEDQWFLTYPLMGGRRFKEWITPMIHLTYTYFEK